MKFTYYFSKFIKKIQIPSLKETTLHSTSKVCSSSHVVNGTIGKYSYIGNHCTVIDTKVGSFCSIADNCIIGGAAHPINWVSTSPVFYSGKNIMRKNFSLNQFTSTKETIVGNDVWIGNNCLIKSGVVIADGAIIGMGSVVTKNIGPYEIWAGNPAKLIKKRFSDEKISELLNIQWWLWNETKLKKEAIKFNNINDFIESKKEEDY